MLEEYDEKKPVSSGKWDVKVGFTEVVEVPIQKTVLVNGKLPKNESISLSISELKELTLTTEDNKVERFSLKIPGVETQLISGNKVKENNHDAIKQAKIDDILLLLNIKLKDGSIAKPIVIKIVD